MSGNEPVPKHDPTPALQPDMENPPPKPAPKEDSYDSDDSEKHMNAGVVNTKNKLVDEEKKEEKEKKKKAIFFVVLCCIFLIFLILLIIFFIPDKGGAGRAQAGDNVTDAPTLTPTIATGSPTLSPVVPNGEPTESPTLAPTDGSVINPPESSRLPCTSVRLQPNVTEGNHGENNFNFFQYTLGGEVFEVCGDTFGGFDSTKPNRNQWSSSQGRRDCTALGFFDGHKMCDFVGARWCTADELDGDVAQGTGCGGDRNPVWTNTPCSVNEQDGIYMINIDIDNDGNRRTILTCQTDLSVTSIIRCCADNY